MVNGEIRARVAFADPAVATAELEALLRLFSLILSHRLLLIRSSTSVSGQNGGQFTLDRSPFGSGLGQKIAEPQH